MSIQGIIIAVIMFLVLVVSHEFGHFIVAKLMGVRVLEFSVGMGPLIYQTEKNGTEYSLRAIPIGGFCRLLGEDGDTDDDDDYDDDDGAALSYHEHDVIFPPSEADDGPDPASFSQQHALTKIAILAAGAAMNILLGFVLFTFVFTHAGQPTTKVGDVIPGYPAEDAGIIAGDRLLAVDGRDIETWYDFTDAIDKDEDGLVEITVERRGRTLSFDCRLQESEDGRMIVGITTKLRHDILPAAREGLTAIGDVYRSVFDLIRGLFNRTASPGDVVGVVGIVSLVGESAVYGIDMVLYLVGVISVNLAAVNLLPVPALDGGRILFVIIRALSGGRISARTEAIVNGIGMLILLTLMVLLIFKDAFTFIL